MKRGSTLILQAAVVVLGLFVLGICVILLPLLIKEELLHNDFDYGPIMLGLYVTAIPFFFALFQTIKLIRYIEQSKPFSELSIRALNKIKYCALAISGMFSLGLPYIFHVAQQDDAPGLVLMTLIIVGTSFVIATSAAVLQKLVQGALDIKSENDLTV